jgi:hypothetical protein
LAALAIAHTPGGLFGFREAGLRPAPQTLVAITVEALATILLTVAMQQAHRAVRSEGASEHLEHPRRSIAEAA